MLLTITVSGDLTMLPSCYIPDVPKLVIVDIEHYLQAQHTNPSFHCIIGGSQGAGKSTLISQLEANAHGQALADQPPCW